MHDDLSDVAASVAPLDLDAAGRDLWPGGTLDLWLGGEVPRLERVFWPETDDEVAAVLSAAAASGTPVVPYGAGSGVCGGARGREGTWVIDTKRFDAIGTVDPETWSVEVGAGVNGQHLEDALAAAGWTLGHSPSSIGCSTVGGWAAARSAGQFSSRYGVFEDMVLGLDGVSPGAGPFHVGVPGPSSPDTRLPDDQLPLLLGSEGTLAVITRVRVRVRPVPATRVLRGFRFPDVASTLEAMRWLMQQELWPSVVRLYDPVDTLIGGKTKPKSDHPSGGWWKGMLQAVADLPPWRRRLLALPLSLPSAIQGIAERLSGGCLLIVGWEGDPEVVSACAEAGLAHLRTVGTDLGEDPGQRWYASRHAVSYKLMPVFERGGFADTMEIAAPWSVMPKAYEAVREAVRPTALVMAHMSHAYPEGGCIYFSFAGRGDRDVYDATWAAALDAVVASGATVTHHHGVGALKAAHATEEVGAAVAGFWSAKDVHDPDGILNPGRVYLRQAVQPAPQLATPKATDGLAWVDPAKPDASGARRRWPWTRLPAPPQWARSPWQTGWLQVRAEVDGVEAAVGRGPRSASGPDLRPWLAASGQGVRCTVATADPKADTWMGTAKVDHPWAVARDLLRSDLRPSALGVVDGQLHVGFRGAAAAALGALAAARVPGGLARASWKPVPLRHDAVVPCAADDPEAGGATAEHVLKPAGEATDG